MASKKKVETAEVAEKEEVKKVPEVKKTSSKKSVKKEAVISEEGAVKKTVSKSKKEETAKKSDEDVKVTKKTNDNVKLKPAIISGVGLIKNEFRSKTTQQRYKKPFAKRPFPKSNHNVQPNYQHNGWNQNFPRPYQTPDYMPWNPYPSFPYMNQINGMFNPNGPMRYWGPNT